MNEQYIAGYNPYATNMMMNAQGQLVYRTDSDIATLSKTTSSPTQNKNVASPQSNNETFNDILSIINAGSASVFDILNQINNLRNAQLQSELMRELQRSGMYTIPRNVYDMYPNIDRPMSETTKWLIAGGAILFLGIILLKR